MVRCVLAADPGKEGCDKAQHALDEEDRAPWFYDIFIETYIVDRGVFRELQDAGETGFCTRAATSAPLGGASPSVATFGPTVAFLPGLI